MFFLFLRLLSNKEEKTEPLLDDRLHAICLFFLAMKFYFFIYHFGKALEGH